MLRPLLYLLSLIVGITNGHAKPVESIYLTKIEIASNREQVIIGRGLANDGVKVGSDDLLEVGTVVDLQSIFLNLVNDHRKNLGLRRLIENEAMTAIAGQHSKDMAANGVSFGHKGFRERCSVISAELGETTACVENIGFGDKTPQEAFKSWLSNKKHRKHLENPKFTHSGLGYGVNADGTYFWTHMMIGR